MHAHQYHQCNENLKHLDKATSDPLNEWRCTYFSLLVLDIFPQSASSLARHLCIKSIVFSRMDTKLHWHTLNVDLQITCTIKQKSPYWLISTPLVNFV